MSRTCVKTAGSPFSRGCPSTGTATPVVLLKFTGIGPTYWNRTNPALFHRLTAPTSAAFAFLRWSRFNALASTKTVMGAGQSDQPLPS
jgi:hypothetical protein